MQIKALEDAANGVSRFRVVLSDIDNYVQSMLASQANWAVQEGKLKKGCFIRLKQFSANIVKEKMRIIIILDLEVLEELGEHEKIGTPVIIKGDGPEVSKPQPTTISSDGFYGNKLQGQNTGAVQATLPSRPTGTSTMHTNISPIEALTPYGHLWTIKVRCTSKGEIKHWHNTKGEGKLFSANFLDESGEIRATGFNDQCDQLYDLIQEGGVYYISAPCKIQLAKKQFSNLSNDYEMTFEAKTKVEKAEDATDVPQIRFNFTSIGDLQKVEKDTTIDTIGVLKEIGEVSQITSKTTSKPYTKREITLVDQSGYSVRVTLWGASANNFDTAEESIVAIKGLKVSDFGGRSLSLLSSGSIAVDPDIDEAHKLKGWYKAQGRTDTFASHASMGGAVGTAGGRSDPVKTITQVRDENLGMTDQVDYFSTKATVIYVKQDNVSYPACLTDGCNKKVVETDPGQWRCERCDKTHAKPEYRYIMSINVSDHTGQLWLSCFDEVGRVIMGVSADQLNELREEDAERAGRLFQEANCKTWLFRCRAKMDSFQDQQRLVRP